MTERFDVAVIGGGPAGTVVSMLIARAGHRVALFERRAFPRFQVGESLVPACNLTLEKVNVLDQLDDLRFPRKHAVQFFSRKGPSRPFYFSAAKDSRMHHTWQVLRSEFDALLLDNARQAGVEAFTEVEVLGICSAGDTVSGIGVRKKGKAEETVEARVVVDASGQRGLLARQLGERNPIDGLANTSVYAHYRDVVRDSGIDAGSTLIFRLDSESWIWFIPLPDTVSIGLVLPAGRISSSGHTPDEALDAAIASCEPLRDRLSAASRTTEVRRVRDVSYRASRDGGPGWALVGDALGFIDPIYSTGLFLTMLSTELAAEGISQRLQSESGPPDLTGFSAEYQTAFDRFLVLVRAFYSPDFHFGKLAKDPQHRQGLGDLLTGMVSTPEAIAVTTAIQSAIASPS